MKKDEDNLILAKSKAFALRIIRLYKHLCDEKKEFVLSKQVLRSGTSIGANAKEASMAQSKKDFEAKLFVSLKEAAETEYWLELALKAEIVSEESVKSLLHDCGTIRRMLIASINTTKENLYKSE